MSEFDFRLEVAVTVDGAERDALVTARGLWKDRDAIVAVGSNCTIGEPPP